MKTYVQPWICKVKGETETNVAITVNGKGSAGIGNRDYRL